MLAMLHTLFICNKQAWRLESALINVLIESLNLNFVEYTLLIGCSTMAPDLSVILPRVLIVSRRTVRKNKFVDFVGTYIFILSLSPSV